MPRFRVEIESESPRETARALDAASVPRLGPADAAYRDAPGPPTTGDLLFAEIEAADARAAVVKVQEIVGANCKVGPAKAVSE